MCSAVLSVRSSIKDIFSTKHKFCAGVIVFCSASASGGWHCSSGCSCPSGGGQGDFSWHQALGVRAGAGCQGAAAEPQRLAVGVLFEGLALGMGVGADHEGAAAGLGVGAMLWGAAAGLQGAGTEAGAGGAKA